MDARTGHRQKRLSKQQEQRTAEDIGGRTQANSGATRLGGGGDVRGAGDIRVECKFTEKDAYILRLANLEKIHSQAIKVLEQPVLQFAFKARTGRLDTYAVIPWRPINEEYHSISTGNKSIGLDQEWLRVVLLNNKRIRVIFHGPPKKSFEVMRWDDYLMTREAA